MITQKTTFILGAGASMAYGFPSGKTLKALIWKKLELKTAFGVAKQRLPIQLYLATDCNVYDWQAKEDFEEKVNKFRNDLILSPDETIDYFLEHVNGEEYRKIGRLAIANILLEREQEKYLFEDWMEYNSIEKNTLQQKFLEGTYVRPEDGHWYQFLFNQMCRECKSIDCFPKNNVSIITFNYDRSFEYYFLRSLMAKYKKTEQEAANILKQLPIVHVYGQLGELPQLSLPSENKKKILSVPYNPLSIKGWSQRIDEYGKITAEQQKYADSLKNAADGIQLIWDSPEKSPNIQKAQELIYSNDNRLVFLGFGFDPINLERIMPQSQISGNAHIMAYGTVFKLSKQRIQYLQKKYIVQHASGYTQDFFHLMETEKSNLKNCNISDFLFNSTEIFR